jgi:hypothetical protein
MGSPNLEWTTMTPQFLRDEAQRLRSMAERADQQRSQRKLLTVANDYDALADAAEANPGDCIQVLALPPTQLAV